MKNRILFLFLIIISKQLFSQSKFQNGYLVINNEKKECIIQNENWLNTPKTISYKLSVDSPVITSEVKKIQELYIYNTNQKYLMAQVNTPQTKEQIIKEKRFLKCLLIGDASLYSYTTNGEVQFFFKINNSNIVQLIYNKSIKDSKIIENNYYKQQLFTRLKCNSITESNLNSISFTKPQLLKVFKRYNTCKSVEFVNYDQYKSKGKFSLSIISGASLFGIGDENIDSYDKEGITMNSKNNFKIGLNAEYRFSLYRNKMGIYSELNYSIYKSEGSYILRTSSSTPSNGGIGLQYYSFKSNFSLLEIPLGLRYYSFLNAKNSFFYNAALSYGILLFDKNDITFRSFDITDEEDEEGYGLQSGAGFNLGIGYKYNSRFGIEVRFTQMNILKIKNLKGDSKTISFLLSYTL